MSRKWVLFAAGIAAMPLAGLANDFGFENVGGAFAAVAICCMAAVVLIAID